MIFEGSPEERLIIILEALAHEADSQNDFVAGLKDGVAKDAARRKAVAIMALFDAIGREGGYK